LYAAVLQDHITKIWGWDESWQQRDFDDHFVPGNIQVAIVNDSIVAYIHVDPTDAAPHVRMMCVAPDYQRQGIGGALLNTIVQDCAAQRQDVVLLVFRINTDAKRFYERLGFTVCGETDTHYKMRRKA
jgi:ribosomal protein S18 acetylase RimI-like enzyme